MTIWFQREQPFHCFDVTIQAQVQLMSEIMQEIN
jgi:hypothetical protein